MSDVDGGIASNMDRFVFCENGDTIGTFVEWGQELFGRTSLQG